MPGWLRDPNDARVAVQPEGTLVGSDHASTIVIVEGAIPPRHLLLLQSPSGTELVVVEGAAPRVNGQLTESRALLADGDVLEIAGRRFVHEWTADPPRSEWLVELGSSKFRVGKSPFVIGGDERDDLVVPALSASAVALYAAGDDLVLEPRGPIIVSGRETHEHVSLRDRDTLVIDHTRLRVRRTSGGEPTTVAERGLPSRVTLELFPNGGLLTVRTGAETRAVWLADTRCDLVAALLRPPVGAAEGAFVSDERLLRSVWPGDAATRGDLNTLVYRVRQTLTRAGLDGATLVERALARGGTRFVVGQGAKVDVVG